MKSARYILFYLLCIFASGKYAFSQNTLWQGSQSSDFNTAGNWNFGTPTPTDRTIGTIREGGYANPNPVLSGSASMGQLRIGQLGGGAGTTPTLTLGAGSALTTTIRTDVGYSLSGDASNSSGALTVNGGNHNLGSLYIGNVAGGNNAVNASGTTTINGGTVNLSNGGFIAARSVTTSTGTSTGSLIIRGGSLSAAGSTFQVGQRGSGTLSLEGGSATFNNGLRLADQAGSSAMLNLASGTLDVASGFFTLGAGTLAINIDKGILQLNGNRTGLLGTLFADSDVTLTITGGLVADSAEDTALSTQYSQNLGEITDSNGNKIYYGFDGDDTKMWSVIPEPPTYALFGGFLALLFVMIRHRK